MHELEPFGCAVEDYRAGIAAAAYENVHRDPETMAPRRPLDYFQWHGEPVETRVDTPEEAAAKIRSLLNSKGSKAPDG